MNRRIAVLLIAGCLMSTTVWAQTRAEPAAPSQQRPGLVEQDKVNPPDTDHAQPILPTPPRIPATGFVMPDVPDEWNRATSYDGRLFSTIFSLVPLIDYNAFVQDDDSKAQVGEQKDEWDVRTLRIMFRGKMKFAHPVDYFISVEVKGKDHVQNG